MYNPDIGRAIETSRRGPSDGEIIRNLLRKRQTGERGFLPWEPAGELGSSVKVVTDAGGNKSVVCDSPACPETDGQSLTSEQIRQVDWNDDLFTNRQN